MKAKLLKFITENKQKVAEYLAQGQAEATTDDGAYEELYDMYLNGRSGLTDSSPLELLESVWEMEVTDEDDFKVFKENVLGS